jgi:hypothetical protein
MIENSVVSCPPCHVAGGDWHYTRYSTLFQINVNDVKNLKGACVSHLGSLWPTVVPWSWLSPRSGAAVKPTTAPRNARSVLDINF